MRSCQARRRRNLTGVHVSPRCSVRNGDYSRDCPGGLCDAMSISKRLLRVTNRNRILCEIRNRARSRSPPFCRCTPMMCASGLLGSPL